MPRVVVLGGGIVGLSTGPLPPAAFAAAGVPHVSGVRLADGADVLGILS